MAVFADDVPVADPAAGGFGSLPDARGGIAPLTRAGDPVVKSQSHSSLLGRVRVVCSEDLKTPRRSHYPPNRLA